MQTTLTTTVTVDIPATASDWELYVGQPGAEEAAQALYQAVCALITATPLGCDATTLYRAVQAHLDPVMLRHDALGACDTEPRYHLRRTLAAVYGRRVVEAAL